MGVTPIYGLPWPNPTDPADGPAAFQALAVASEAALVGGGPAYVTALPASPVDGQEVYYGADPAAGVIWHLRYRSAATGAYKWEYVGGTALAAPTQAAAAGPNFTTAVYAAPTTGTSPVVTPPLAGYYRIYLGMYGYCSGGGAQSGFAQPYQAGGPVLVAGPSDAEGLVMSSTTTYLYQNRERIYGPYLANVPISMRGRATLGGMPSDYADITIAPVRVG